MCWASFLNGKSPHFIDPRVRVTVPRSSSQRRLNSLGITSPDVRFWEMSSRLPSQARGGHPACRS
jgi:hypothetical protein